MTASIDKIPAIEKKLINPMITASIKAGYALRVHDGEEWSTDWTTDRAEVREYVGATDETILAVSEGGEWIGQIVCIHGNEEDVISDWTDNDKIDAIVRPVLKKHDII